MGSPSEPRPARTASGSTPASMRAARVMSPLTPLKQSKCKARKDVPPWEDSINASGGREPPVACVQQGAHAPRWSGITRSILHVTLRQLDAGVLRELARRDHPHAVGLGVIDHLVVLLVELV